MNTINISILIITLLSISSIVNGKFLEQQKVTVNINKILQIDSRVDYCLEMYEPSKDMNLINFGKKYEPFYIVYQHNPTVAGDLFLNFDSSILEFHENKSVYVPFKNGKENEGKLLLFFWPIARGKVDIVITPARLNCFTRIIFEIKERECSKLNTNDIKAQISKPNKVSNCGGR